MIFYLSAVIVILDFSLFIVAYGSRPCEIIDKYCYDDEFEARGEPYYTDTSVHILYQFACTSQTCLTATNRYFEVSYTSDETAKSDPDCSTEGDFCGLTNSKDGFEFIVQGLCPNTSYHVTAKLYMEVFQTQGRNSCKSVDTSFETKNKRFIGCYDYYNPNGKDGHLKVELWPGPAFYIGSYGTSLCPDGEQIDNITFTGQIIAQNSQETNSSCKLYGEVEPKLCLNYIYDLCPNTKYGLKTKVLEEVHCTIPKEPNHPLNFSITIIWISNNSMPGANLTWKKPRDFMEELIPLYNFTLTKFNGSLYGDDYYTDEYYEISEEEYVITHLDEGMKFSFQVRAMYKEREHNIIVMGEAAKLSLETNHKGCVQVWNNTEFVSVILSGENGPLNFAWKLAPELQGGEGVELRLNLLNNDYCDRPEETVPVAVEIKHLSIFNGEVEFDFLFDKCYIGSVTANGITYWTNTLRTPALDAKVSYVREESSLLTTNKIVIGLTTTAAIVTVIGFLCIAFKVKIATFFGNCLEKCPCLVCCIPCFNNMFLCQWAKGKQSVNAIYGTLNHNENIDQSVTTETTNIRQNIQIEHETLLRNQYINHNEQYNTEINMANHNNGESSGESTFNIGSR